MSIFNDLKSAEQASRQNALASYYSDLSGIDIAQSDSRAATTLSRHMERLDKSAADVEADHSALAALRIQLETLDALADLDARAEKQAADKAAQAQAQEDSRVKHLAAFRVLHDRDKEIGDLYDSSNAARIAVDAAKVSDPLMYAAAMQANGNASAEASLQLLKDAGATDANK